MNSEGKIFAPKPIRKSATALPLKPNKSKGCPNSNAESNCNNKNKTNDNYTNNFSKKNRNNLFEEFEREIIRIKPSNSFFPGENIKKKSDNELAEKKKFVSYEEFDNDIDNDFAKQLATLEILSILSSGKRNLEFNKQANFNNFYTNEKFDYCNSSFTRNDFDCEYFFNDNKQENQKKFASASDNITNLKVKNYNLNINFDSNVHKNQHKDGNFIEDRYSNNSNERQNQNKNMSDLSNFFNSLRNKNDFELENFISNNNLIQNDQNKIETNNTDNVQNINEFSENNKCPISLINRNTYISNNNKENKFKTTEKNLSIQIYKQSNSEINKENKNKNSLSEKNFNEKSDKLSQYDDDSNKQISKNTDDKFIDNANKVLFFLEENFFLELQSENLGKNSLYTSLEKTAKENHELETFTNLNSNELCKSSVPIRCKNPFLKSLKKEGFNKIKKFLDNKQLAKQNNFLTHSYQETIQNFLFSEKVKFQTKKINICKM